jgi:hypothetical protein
VKTAIQELIEWFHNRPEYDKTSEGYEIMEKAKELLEKENKQIMDSWKEGTKYIMDINDGKVITPMSAIDYLIYFKTEKSDYYTSF